MIPIWDRYAASYSVYTYSLGKYYGWDGFWGQKLKGQGCSDLV